MMEEKKFADVLRRCMDHAPAGLKFGPRRLAQSSGVNEATIKSWLKGDVSKPRWRDLVRVAGVLQTDQTQTDQLIQLAGYQSLEALRTKITNDHDRRLFLPWDLPHVRGVVPQDRLIQAQERWHRLPIKEIPKLSPLPPISRLGPRQNPIFVGRTAVLLSLAKAIKQGHRCMIVTGMGGIGKTQVANAFAYHYGSYFMGGVFWLSFARPEQIRAEIAACGRTLGVESGFEHLPLEKQVEVILRFWNAGMPTLLIWDNCDDPALLRTWLPLVSGCTVVVTSRCVSWDSQFDGEVFPLSVFSRKESIVLLEQLSRLMDRATRSIFDQIAHILADLPLPLALAGRYLKQYAGVLTPKAYLEQLQSTDGLNHPSMYGESVVAEDYPLHVWASMRLSYQRLDASNPTDQLAQSILLKIAQLAPGEFVSRDLLYSLLQLSDDSFHVQAQVEDSLVRLVMLGLLEDHGRLRIHRLLAIFVRSIANEAVRAASQIMVETGLLEKIVQENEHGNILTMLDNHVHVRHVIDQARERLIDLYLHLGEHFWRIPDLVNAEYYLEQARAICTASTTVDMYRLAAIENIRALIFLAQCRYPQSQLASEKVLAIWEHVELAPMDTKRSVELSNLGYLFILMGKHRAAAKLLHQSLQIWHHAAANGTHPEAKKEIGRRLTQLGYLSIKQGHFWRARRYLWASLAIRRQTLGEAHLATAMTWSHLGEAVYALGQHRRAYRYYQLAKKIRDDWYKGENIASAESLYLLGQLACARGQYDQAYQQLTQAYGQTQRIVGDSGRQNALILHGLGHVAFLCGHYDEANRSLALALGMWESLFDEDHPDTALTLYCLGKVSLAQGDTVTAEKYLSRAAIMEKNVLEPLHPHRMKTLLMCAKIAAIKSDPRQRDLVLAKALNLARRRYGFRHRIITTIKKLWDR